MPDPAAAAAPPAEAVLEPLLPIIDPHHHLWDLPGSRYLLPELLADTGSTDAQGDISWTPSKPGIYMALVRHRAPAPEGATAPTYGYNYTLTFRVLAQ